MNGKQKTACCRQKGSSLSFLSFKEGKKSKVGKGIHVLDVDFKLEFLRPVLIAMANERWMATPTNGAAKGAPACYKQGGVKIFGFALLRGRDHSLLSTSKLYAAANSARNCRAASGADAK